MQPQHSDSSPPRVLIVDDDEDSLIIYERFLGLAGYETSRARSGTEALRRASSEPPAAVLLDLVLPDMHGSELAMLFRATPGLEHIPIVGITARVTPDLLSDPDSVPVPRLLLKPTSGGELVEAIRESLEAVT
ncbi:MAG TPA: response regulator [Gemmatimonadaceae bacterium]